MANESNQADKWQTALGGQSSTEEALSPATEDSETEVRAENSIVDDVELGEGEDTLQDPSGSGKPSEAAKGAQANPKVSGEKEVITVTDESGRKRKVEIDYSNREAIKKAYAAAAGMRKFQAERDQSLLREKTKDSELSEYKTNWQTLEQAFQKGGEEGLIDLLRGRQGAYKEQIKKELDKAKFLENASPEELEQFNAREEAEKLRQEHAKLRKENEEFKKKVTEEREQSELKETQSRVYPVFDKYRFAEKLGDSNDEHMFDQMLWNTALERLKPYEEQGLDLSPELVDREFRNVAASIRKRINLQAERKVDKVVEQKKREATENVQAKVKSSYSKDGDAEKLKALIKSGDTGSIFKNWGTFSKLLSNNRK